MQKSIDLKRRLDSGPLARSIVGSRRTLAFARSQESLDDIGGEPLAGSGFENESVESEFAARGEES
jgi:hypothetical protein